MKRALLRFMAWVAGLALVAACVVAAVNAFDEARLPDDPALAVSRRPVAPERNAYLLLVGFEAPRDVDPIAHGARLVREHDAEATQDPSMRGRAEAITARGAESQDGGLRYAGKGAAYCAFATAACRDAIAASTQIESSLRANAELVARYRRLLALSDFENVAAASTFVPMFASSSFQVRLLLVAEAVAQARRGGVRESLAFLEADAVFWRRVLESGPAVIDAMLAARALHDDFAAVSGVLSERPSDLDTMAPRLREVLKPVGFQRGLARTLAREYEFDAQMIESSEMPTAQAPVDGAARLRQALSGLPQPMLYQPVATRNTIMALFRTLQAQYANPALDCVDMAAASLPAKFTEPDVRWIYNPVGKAVISASASWFHAYAARMCDLSAHAQLVRAQLEAGVASVPSSEVPRYLSAHPELANPLTRQAFAWSPGARVLWFTPNDHRWAYTEGDVLAEIPPPAR